jgi:GNAT superfamily N-acetyltransferase
LKIRPFKADYDDFARIHNQVYAEFAQSAEELRFDDDKRAPYCRHERWVAESDGAIVAYAQYDQHAGTYHPQKFGIEVTVQPDAVGRDIGRALYGTVIDALRPFDPININAWTRDDFARGTRFLHERGFVESMRLWVSELDMASYDPRPFEKYTQQVLADGVDIKTRAELVGDPDLNRKLYDLWMEVRQDMPLPPGEVRIETPFEEWLNYQDHPSRLDDGYFLAFVDGELAGTSQLWLSLDEPDLLRTGLTGVRRAYRRRGIAFALKLCALDFAKRQPGIRRVITDNGSTNRPMLAINEALGFVKHPAWVMYQAEWADATRR